MQRTFYQFYRGLAWLFLAGAVLQFFLAGLGVFGAASFGPHQTVGKLLARRGGHLGPDRWPVAREGGAGGAAIRAHGRAVVVGGSVLGECPDLSRLASGQRPPRTKRGLRPSSRR